MSLQASKAAANTMTHLYSKITIKELTYIAYNRFIFRSTLDSMSITLNEMYLNLCSVLKVHFGQTLISAD